MRTYIIDDFDTSELSDSYSGEVWRLTSVEDCGDSIRFTFKVTIDGNVGDGFCVEQGNCEELYDGKYSISIEGNCTLEVRLKIKKNVSNPDSFSFNFDNDDDKSRIIDYNYDCIEDNIKADVSLNDEDEDEDEDEIDEVKEQIEDELSCFDCLSEEYFSFDDSDSDCEFLSGLKLESIDK